MSTSDWIVVISAILAGIGGCISAWAALVRAKKEGAEDCERRVREARAEAETVADELHRARMARGAQ